MCSSTRLFSGRLAVRSWAGVSPPVAKTSPLMHRHPLARLTPIRRHLDAGVPLKILAVVAVAISPRNASTRLARYRSGGVSTWVWAG